MFSVQDIFATLLVWLLSLYLCPALEVGMKLYQGVQNTFGCWLRSTTVSAERAPA